MLKLISLITVLAAAAVPALAQNRTTTPESRGIMRFDGNKDGFVDRAEWKAGQEARFRQLDADSDGKLTADELSRRPAGATGVLPTDARNTRESAFFRRLDSNRDGSVSLAEYLAESDRRFARCDTNKDDRTNTEECRTAMRRQPATTLDRTR